MSDGNTRHVSDDRLLDLAARLLGPDEAETVLAEIGACPECESRFRGLCGEVEILRSRGRPAGLASGGPFPIEAAGERSTERSRRTAAPAPWRRRGAWISLAVAAAAILAVVLVVRYEKTPIGAEDGLDYWLPIESQRALMRAARPEDDAAARYSEALEAYRRRDTRRVVRLLEGEPIPESYDAIRMVFASALVWEGRLGEARAALDALKVEALPIRERDQARWILMTVLRRGGDPAGAQRMLRDLASRPGPFSEKARLALTAPPSPP